MIQRIQSVYWFLSIILVTASLFLSQFKFGTEGGHFHGNDCTIYIVVVALIIVFSVGAIGSFKERKRQLQLSYVTLALYIVGHVLLWGHYYLLTQGELPAQSGDAVAITPFVFLITAALLTHLLAIRGVKKDEKLIKSLDRLR